MTAKLSPTMQAALAKLAKVKTGDAYTLRVSVSTLEALSKRGFCTPFGSGHIAFPKSGLWQITEAGKAAAAKVSA